MSLCLKNWRYRRRCHVTWSVWPQPAGAATPTGRDPYVQFDLCLLCWLWTFVSTSFHQFSTGFLHYSRNWKTRPAGQVFHFQTVLSHSQSDQIRCTWGHNLTGKLPFDCQKIAKNLKKNLKRMPKIFIFLKKCQVFGNFLTVKWQFSRGLSPIHYVSCQKLYKMLYYVNGGVNYQHNWDSSMDQQNKTTGHICDFYRPVGHNVLPQ